MFLINKVSIEEFLQEIKEKFVLVELTGSDVELYFQKAEVKPEPKNKTFHALSKMKFRLNKKNNTICEDEMANIVFDFLELVEFFIN